MEEHGHVALASRFLLLLGVCSGVGALRLAPPLKLPHQLQFKYFSWRQRTNVDLQVFLFFSNCITIFRLFSERFTFSVPTVYAYM